MRSETPRAKVIKRAVITLKAKKARSVKVKKVIQAPATSLGSNTPLFRC